MFHLARSRSMKGPLLAAIACVVGVGLAAAPTLLANVDAAPRGDGNADEGVTRLEAKPAGSARSRNDRPTWEVGDSWLVAFGDGDPVCRAVVASADESGYRQGWWCAEDGLADYIAAQFAAFGIPYAGALTRDLAGRDGDMVWYDWPLADGKTWTAEYYGTDLDVTARWDAKDGRYVITAESEGDAFATWDYIPELRWWSALEFAGGWRFSVLDRVPSWDGQVTLADAERRYQEGGSQIVVGYSAPGVFTALADDEALYMVMQRGDGLWAEHVDIRAPDGSSMYQQQIASNVLGSGDPFVADLLPGIPGTWTVLRAGSNLGYSYISIWGVSFTRERVA